MTIVNFRELIKEGSHGAHNNETPTEIDSSVYQSTSINANELERVHSLYRTAYVNKQKVQNLLKLASDACDEAKAQMLELVKYTDYENSDFKLQHIKRQGNVDWRRFESRNPDVDLGVYRNKDTYFWTLKLKVKE